MEVNVNIATTIAHDIRNGKIPIAFAFIFDAGEQRRRREISTVERAALPRLHIWKGRLTRPAKRLRSLATTKKFCGRLNA